MNTDDDDEEEDDAEDGYENAKKELNDRNQLIEEKQSEHAAKARQLMQDIEWVTYYYVDFSSSFSRPHP